MLVKATMKQIEDGGWRIILGLVTHVDIERQETYSLIIHKDYQYLDEAAVNMKAGAVAAKVQFSPNPELYFEYLCSMGWSPYLPE